MAEFDTQPLAEKLPPRAMLLPGSLAPDFTFTTPDGKAHQLSDYRGKVVLLDFWGTVVRPVRGVRCRSSSKLTRSIVRAAWRLSALIPKIPRMSCGKFVAEKKLAWVPDQRRK